MTGIYLTDMLDVLRDAGCQVAESSTTNGWQKRARSSGGFPTMPLGVQWHHTASRTSPANDLSWMIVGCSDAPVGNLLLDRTGTYWPIAAGAANTAGKGGPLTMSRGTVPQDQANSRTFAIEAANDGVGEAWPVAQVDAYFAGSNALNVRFGNLPTDVFNHQTWAPTRKIDPATAAAVAGTWRPTSSTSSGTWRQSDVTAECLARAGTKPTPEPDGDDMTDDQAQQLNDVYYWLRQLVTERGWPNVPVYGESLDAHIDARLEASDLAGKVRDLWYWMQQLTQEVDWPNAPAYRQSLANLRDEQPGGYK